MARIDLDALKKEDEARKKEYVWNKPLTIRGRKIEATKPETINKGENHG